MEEVRKKLKSFFSVAISLYEADHRFIGKQMLLCFHFLFTPNLILEEEVCCEGAWLFLDQHHGRRFLRKAPAVIVGFWGLVTMLKGPRLLQAPSHGNVDLYRFLLNVLKWLCSWSYILRNRSLRKEFLHVFLLLGMCGSWRSEVRMLESVLPSIVEVLGVRLRVSVRLEGTLAR